MKKLVGVFAFLLLVYGALLFSHPNARSALNHNILGQRIGYTGIITLAVGQLIITGGIDLSIGSVVALTATVFCMLVQNYGWAPFPALLAILGLGAAIGLLHGLLVAKLRLQAFIVTLCGMFAYRGLARWLTNDQIVGLGNTYPELKEFMGGDLFGVPVFLWVFLVLLTLFGVFLHRSVVGRYFFAIGSNEKAAHYSGIGVDFYKILAFMICSTLTAFYGFLSAMYNNNAIPSGTGQYAELIAIAGAVLGGCSLRGGEGSALGILFGACIIIILQNLTQMYNIKDQLADPLIGVVLLLGAILDEALRKDSAARKAFGRLRQKFQQ